MNIASYTRQIDSTLASDIGRAQQTIVLLDRYLALPPDEQETFVAALIGEMLVAKARLEIGRRAG